MAPSRYASLLRTTAPALAALTSTLVPVVLFGALSSGSPDDSATGSASSARGQADKVVDLHFGSPSAGSRFRTHGPGRWTVRRGAYRLTRATGGPPSLSVLRPEVPAQGWQLETWGRSHGDEHRVLFDYRSRRHHSFVQLDRHSARSGVFVVRGGRATRVARLAARVPVRRPHKVTLERSATDLKVHLEAPGDGRAFAARVDLPAPDSSRVGVGSRRSGLAVRRLRLTWQRARPPQVRPPTPSPTAYPTPATPPPGGRAVNVSSSAGLTAALADARAGDVITLADGRYTSRGRTAPLVLGGKQYVGTFVVSVPGTASAPIVLQGSRAAVIDAKPGRDGTGTRYGLYLAGADHWRVQGLTVTNVAKGVVLDRTSHTVLDGLAVHDIGQEGIHLRAFSSDNVVRDSVVFRTGRRSATYGEGIYVGSAHSNWDTYTGGAPDASDRNLLIGNVISRTGAESVDVKEGTSGGVIRANWFEGSTMTGSWADSWIDLKGNGWLVEGNRGVNAPLDGFQVHTALPGWGNDNVFRSNSARVDARGYGFSVQQGATGTVVSCGTNVVTRASSGFSDVPCTRP